jgi:hypothetical protein
MPTSTRSTGYRKPPSTEPAQTAPKPKAVVTIHPNGKVTATGPEAAAGKAEAEKGVTRVKATVAATNKYEREHGGGEDINRRQSFKPKGLGINLGNIGKTILSVAEAQDPSSSITRKYAEGEAKNLADVAKESVTPGREARGIVKAPSAKETQAALTIVGGTTGGSEAGVGEKALAKAASQASNAETAAKAGAKVVAKIKGAPKAAAKNLRDYPKKKVEAVKSAPRRAKATAKRAPELKTKAGQKAAAKAAGRSAKRHPFKSGYLGAAALPPGTVPGEIGERARAAAVGSVDALVNHPGETLKTTARALPAAITGPVALGAAAIDSAVHGTPKPLENTASEQAKGMAQILANTFSGDTKKAEEAARKEGSLSLLTPLPALSKAKAFKAAEEDVRNVASSARRKVAASSDKANRTVRHAPEGQTQHLFGVAARHDQRKRVSVIKARTDNPHRVAAAEHTNNILTALHKAPAASHIVLQTLAEFGIRDKRGADLIRAKGPGDPQLIAALDYADLHPQIFGDQHIAEALGHLKKSVEGTAGTKSGKGERARLLAQGDALRIPRPEHVVPHHLHGQFGDVSWKEAREKLEATKAGQRENLNGKYGAKRQAEIAKSGVRQTEKTRARLKARAAAKAAKGELVTPKEAREIGKADGQYRIAQRRAKKADKQLKEVIADGHLLNDMLKQARAGETRKVNQVRSKTKWITDAAGKRRKVKFKEPAYGDRELAQYKDRVETARVPAGLAEAIWTHHGSSFGDKGAGLANKFPVPAGRKEYAREGNLAKAGELDRSLEGLVRGTIHAPRLRAAGKEFTRNLVDEFKLPFTKDGKQEYVVQGSKDWAKITQRKTEGNPDGGQYDPRSVARFASREFTNAINDPYLSETQRDAKLLQILKDAETGKTPGSEPSVLMPREAIKEARAQINPEHNILTEGMNKFAKVSNRLILGTNPAWAVAQTVAEGVPLLISHPNLANPIYLAKYLKESKAYGDAHPELRATAGVSPLNGAALRQPGEMIESYTPEQWSKGADAMTRGKLAKSALSFVHLRALGEFDVRRQNAYRKAIYAAERDRKFRSWHSGLTGLFDGAAEISKKFKGKPLAELEDWLHTSKEGKVWKGKLEDHVDAIEGNWTAFTRYERALAPFTIFYPFLRYSLRWTLWAFPKEHPVRATILNLMGQANSNQLEKLVGGPLKNPAAYAFPAYQNANDETQVLPGGSRISPGQSSLTQAVATGNPASVLSSANPFLGAGITGLTGIEPFTGEEAKGPRGLAALEQLMNLPRPASVRIGGKSLTERALGALGTGSEQSPGSKAFETYDPQKNLRSLALPGLPQSGKNFAGAEKLGKELSTKYGEGKIPYYGDSPLFQKVMYGHNGGPNPDAAQRHKEIEEAVKKIHEQEAASSFVKAKEAPFYPPEKKIPEAIEKEIRGAFENAYQTGPNVKSTEGEGSTEGWRSSGSSSSEGWRSSKAASGGWR